MTTSVTSEGMETEEGPGVWGLEWGGGDETRGEDRNMFLLLSQVRKCQWREKNARLNLQEVPHYYSNMRRARRNIALSDSSIANHAER